MKIRYCTHTEIGDRSCNEDRFAVCETPTSYCFAQPDYLPANRYTEVNVGGVYVTSSYNYESEADNG